MTSPDRTAIQVFRRLHEDGLLVLPNAWDAGSARLIESLGAKALATTSAGVAWSHGYADGDQLPASLLVATVAGIARVLKAPLSVDVEGGYSNEPAAVGETVARVIEAGAVGINLEDGGGDPDLLCAKIERARRAGVRLGVDLFVNARTDVYLRGLAPSTELATLGVRRLSAGSSIAQAALGRIASLATAFLRTGASDPLAEGAMPYPEINTLMS